MTVRWFTDQRLDRFPLLWLPYALVGFLGWPFTLLHRSSRST